MSIFDLLKRRKKEEELGVVPDNENTTITSSTFGKQGNFKNESPETQSEDVKFGMPEIETKMGEDSNFGDFNSPSSTTMGNIMGKTMGSFAPVFNNNGILSEQPVNMTSKKTKSLGLPGTDGIPLTLETLRPFYKKHRSAFEGYPGPNDDATDAKFEGRPVISDTLRNYVDELMSEGWKKIDEDNVRNIDILVDFYERNWGSKSQNGGQGSADIFSQMHSTEQPKTMTEPELNTNDKVYTPYQKDGKTQLPNIRVNDPEEKKFYLQANKNILNNSIIRNIAEVSDPYTEKIYKSIYEGLESLPNDMLNKVSDKLTNYVNTTLDGQTDIDNLLSELTNNSTDYSKPMTEYEQKQENFYSGDWAQKHLPMASDSVIDGMHDMTAARKNKGAVVHASYDNISNASIREKFKQLGIPSNAKGVEYNSESDHAQKLANSPEMDKFIDEMVKNGNKPTTNGIEFKKHWIRDPKNSLDRHLGYQHVTILNPKIEKGEFTAQVLDYSDFEKRKIRMNFKAPADIVNNWGYNQQEKGNYIPYFKVVNIRRKI